MTDFEYVDRAVITAAMKLYQQALQASLSGESMPDGSNPIDHVIHIPHFFGPKRLGDIGPFDKFGLDAMSVAFAEPHGPITAEEVDDLLTRCHAIVKSHLAGDEEGVTELVGEDSQALLPVMTGLLANHLVEVWPGGKDGLVVYIDEWFATNQRK